MALGSPNRPPAWSGLQMQRFVNDRTIGRFALVALVEDQRVLPEAPGAAVAQAPERHPLHVVFMFEEYREQARIGDGLGLLVFRRGRCGRARAGAGGSTRRAELTSRSPANRHIEFGDAHLQTQ